MVFATLFDSTARAQPAALTLACKGTTTDSALPDEKSPFSMGMIVNFITRLIQGFGTPGLIDYPVKITGADDVTIVFGGSQEILGGSRHSINGSIDRVTGDVEATTMLSDPKTGKTISTTTLRASLQAGAAYCSEALSGPEGVRC
jgi:hypothetical protein